MRACVRACMRACVRACVRVCVPYILGCMCTYLYVLCSTDAIADRKHSLVCVFVVTAVDNGASNVVVSATAVLHYFRSPESNYC